jgi:hypothetical protein
MRAFRKLLRVESLGLSPLSDDDFITNCKLLRKHAFGIYYLTAN